MFKWLGRTGLAFVLALFSILGMQPAEADICVQPVTCVVLPPVTITVPGPVVTLPRQTVTKKVPYPVTTTDIVRVPGPVRTVTLPRETVTVTENGQTGQTVTSRATVTATETQTVTATPPTETKTVYQTRYKDGVITVEKAKAVGISLGLLLLGGLLALFAMYLAYAVGYKDSELEEEKQAEEALNKY